MPDTLALPVLAAAALLFAVMAAVWATAVRIHNAGIVDIAWSANFSLLAVLYAALGGGFLPRRLLIGGMTLAVEPAARGVPVPARHGPPPGGGRALPPAAAGVGAAREPALLLVLPAAGGPQPRPRGAAPPRLRQPLAADPPARVGGPRPVGRGSRRRVGRGPAARGLPPRPGEPREDLPRRPLAPVPPPQLLLRVARVGGVLRLRPRLALGLGHGLLPGPHALLPLPGHRHPGDRGAGPQEPGRGLPRVPAHHERLLPWFPGDGMAPAGLAQCSVPLRPAARSRAWNSRISRSRVARSSSVSQPRSDSFSTGGRSRPCDRPFTRTRARDVALEVHGGRAVGQAAQGGEDPLAQRVEGRRVAHGVGELLDGGEAVGLAGLLLEHPEAGLPEEQDVVPPVVEPLVLDDRPGAAERVDRRPPLVVLLVPGLEEDDADRAVRPERVLDHLPVARLEDVQRQRRPGEEDDVRQREEGDEAAQCCGPPSPSPAWNEWPQPQVDLAFGFLIANPPPMRSSL